MLDIGPAEEIARQYHEVNSGRRIRPARPTIRQGGEVRLRRVWCEDPAGEPILDLAQGSVARACLEAEVREPRERPDIPRLVPNQMQHTIFVATTSTHGPLGHFEPGSCDREALLRELAAPPATR